MHHHTRTADRISERVGEAAGHVEPHARRARAATRSAGRSALALAASVPALLSRSLGLLAGATGSVAERGREMAYRVEPPTSVRRRSALRTASWFLGGFMAGAATGWVVHARMQEQPQRPDHAPDLDEAGAPYGDAAAAIDARHADAPIH